MRSLSMVCVLVLIVACASDDTKSEDGGGEGGSAGGEPGNGGSGGTPIAANGGSFVAGAGGQKADASPAVTVDAGGDAAGGKSDAPTNPDAGDSLSQLPPTNRKDIEAWIAKGYYKMWKCEASVMNARPNGAHGRNRVCSNDLASANGAGPYPVGAASIKEIYSNNTISIYAAAVKVKAGTAANTWYWYEGSIEGIGNPSCAGCHSSAANYGGHDYVYIQVK